MAYKTQVQQEKYLNILSDGTMRMSVPEGTEGAVTRTYETSDGKTGTKTELVLTELSGRISKVNFYDGAYGKLLQVTITDGDEEPLTLSIGCESNFGEDLMKKLPAIDLEKPVILIPYSFEDDKGKKRRGITVKQDEIKIENFYYDKETKKNKFGYPTPKITKKMDKDKWKLHFMEARMFLIEDITKRFKIEDTLGDDFENLASKKKDL